MTKLVRCAIYTRKSTEEGLEQEFNSLDAQREACAAYILSQKHEGWSLILEQFDDGGFSGGNLDRPGLPALLDQVRAGKVAVIVVYKVDRLTRSLSDFAKIVDVLDAAGASFVSVTQSFNTTTSMGRLTLNVLLSFAQFEREVTGERLRDKIAAAKKKGMWMGGNPPLGYDVADRKLIINFAEADTVRHIFSSYLEAGLVRSLLERLHEEGVTTKSRAGRAGIPFGRGSLRHLLQNPLYLGEVHFKGGVYQGQHEAIIDRVLWDAVQAKFAAAAVDRGEGRRATEPSLLSGLLWDANGGRMTPSHAVKNGQRYRYYVTLADHQVNHAAFRFSAPLLEQAVTSRIAEWLSSAQPVDRADADLVAARLAQSRADIAMLREPTPADQQATIRRYVERVQLGPGRLSIQTRVVEGLRPTLLMATLGRIRCGNGTRIVVRAEPSSSGGVDEQLVQILANARAAQKLSQAHPSRTLAQLPKLAGVSEQRVKQLLRLSFLAPSIVANIVSGETPEVIAGTSLRHLSDIALDWAEQRRAFCSPAASI
ncbi:recombinase family protein [Sphingomonas sp.]|jgi:DNA invertase Pin-like site-specific DNA recombinase|uniref:recombinase family protein n=1 Tax=Sphingomonas sp. TaxID=28214 RepID=UPI002DEACAA1|nr:recombinase family protein [Sphingomonas sp.]